MPTDSNVEEALPTPPPHSPDGFTTFLESFDPQPLLLADHVRVPGVVLTSSVWKQVGRAHARRATRPLASLSICVWSPAIVRLLFA